LLRGDPSASLLAVFKQKQQITLTSELITKILERGSKASNTSSAEHLLHISAHLDRQASLTCRELWGSNFTRAYPTLLSLQILHSTLNLTRTLTSHIYLPITKQITTHLIKMEYNTGAPTGGRACYNCELLSRSPTPGARGLLRARYRVLSPALECLVRSVDDDYSARQQITFALSMDFH
jgi:hypothetical protein